MAKTIKDVVIHHWNSVMGNNAKCIHKDTLELIASNIEKELSKKSKEASAKGKSKVSKKQSSESIS